MIVEKICHACAGRGFFESCFVDTKLPCLVCNGSGTVMDPETESKRPFPNPRDPGTL
jgi:hypothetical protein